MAEADADPVLPLPLLPPPLVAVDHCCILHSTRQLPWQSRVSSQNLASRVRAIVCGENVLLTIPRPNTQTKGCFF